MLTASVPATAQEDNKNILIEDAMEDIRFAKGKGDHPVVVKQTSSTAYVCQDFRTTIPVAEFYNDEMEIKEVSIRMDGSRRRDIIPAYEYHSVDGIFYSDARICYFPLSFTKKGSVGEVSFEKVTLDPRYFTSVYFTESYPVLLKTVSVAVPAWMTVEIKEYNFDGYTISKNVEKKDDETIYTYVMRNAKAYPKEGASPGISHIAPHLLIMSKKAETSDGTITYFSTLADQYAWYHSLVKEIGNEPASIKAKAEEIVQGKTGDEARVKAIYQWAQDNIRYIAYEDGIAGFKPEKAQEVLRKKYGDCKGMGNLVTELLRSLGYDARLCWLGTNHIAHDYTTPSLGVDNHMISAWMRDGKPVFLDATEKYIGFGETAERIQGRQVLIEDGDKYILQNIPTATPQQNTSTEKRVLTVSGTDLTGTVTHTWKGEAKEMILHQLDHIKTDKRDEALRKYLSAGNSAYVISNLKTEGLTDYNANLVISYDLVHKDAVSVFGAQKYLDVDNRKEFSGFSIDTAKRMLPFLFPYKDHTIIEVDITLPAGAQVASLPKPVSSDGALYSLDGKWTATGSKLSYRTETVIKNTYVRPADFAALNSDVKKLKEFYNNQVVLTF